MPTPRLENYALNPRYGDGKFRRLIAIRSECHRAVVDLIDDFHRMRIFFSYPNGVIADVVGEMARYPKTSCPGALQSLRKFEGRSISGCAIRSFKPELPSHCTHLIHLMDLSVGMIARGESARTFQISVDDCDDLGRQDITVHAGRDDELCICVLGGEIVSPASHAGRSMFGGFGRWARKEFSGALSDMWVTAQMALFVSEGRKYIVDSEERRCVGDEPQRENSCFSYSRPQFPSARDMVGFTRDFSDKGLPSVAKISGFNSNE